MYDLTLIKHNGGVYVDSREVAVAIEKRHDHLLRDIGKYREIIEKSTAPNFGGSDFFLESSYFDSTGRKLPCYLLSKMGCELVANKLTGEKGILFTCAYVSAYNEMEQREREAEQQSRAVTPLMAAPRLGEINAFSRLIVMGMKAVGAEPADVMDFLKETYETLGFDFIPADFDEPSALCWLNANGIAKECGMFSLNGKLHGQAAASILKDVLLIGEEHMRREKDHYGVDVGVSTLYDDYALLVLMNWLCENHCPEEITVGGRTFHVQYQL